MQVEFSGMDARWGLSGPELEFYDARTDVSTPRQQACASRSAIEVGIGVSLMRLLFEQTLVVDRRSRCTNTSHRGSPAGERRDGACPGSRHSNELVIDSAVADASGNRRSPIEVIAGRHRRVLFHAARRRRPRDFNVPRESTVIDGRRTSPLTPTDPPARIELGRSGPFSLRNPGTDEHAVKRRERGLGRQRRCPISVELAGWSELAREFPPALLGSGGGDLELALVVAAISAGCRSDAQPRQSRFRSRYLPLGRRSFLRSERTHRSRISQDELAGSPRLTSSASPRSRHEWPDSSLAGRG